MVGGTFKTISPSPVPPSYVPRYSQQRASAGVEGEFWGSYDVRVMSEITELDERGRLRFQQCAARSTVICPRVLTRLAMSAPHNRRIEYTLQKGCAHA